MIYYIVDKTDPQAPIILYLGIEGFYRAKHLRDAIKNGDNSRQIIIRPTKYEYLWGIEAKNCYSDSAFYGFETWDEAAEFGNEMFDNFNTDDIMEIWMGV